ncbi:MAG: Mur ligase family protein [Pseudomonadota bacterium]
MRVPGQANSASVLQIGQGVRQRIMDGNSLNHVDDETGLDNAAEALLDSVFAEPSAARIPVIAVTGTNGKITTTRMIAYIFRQAGLKTGLVSSEGITIGGQQVSHGDSGLFAGHCRVLTDPAIEAAALETHHRGIVVRGFAFDDCDVGICLNVSPDHIARGEIETMAEMEDVKAAVPERASKAAILFADDSHCRAANAHWFARNSMPRWCYYAATSATCRHAGKTVRSNPLNTPLACSKSSPLTTTKTSRPDSGWRQKSTTAC